MTAKKTDYLTLSRELDSVLATLQQDNLDVDTAMAAYEQGLKLVAEIEQYLKQAENTVTKLQATAKGK